MELYDSLDAQSVLRYESAFTGQAGFRPRGKSGKARRRTNLVNIKVHRWLLFHAQTVGAAEAISTRLRAWSTQ
jgi:hypothetical protein